MMKVVVAGLFGSLMVYLFASAPEKLPEQGQVMSGRCQFEVAALFDGANAINDAARAVYTRRIVGGGVKAGLKFGEDWLEPGVEKGPLPALFLRLTAAQLETKPPRLGLYLGSDAPINKSNLFTPEQLVSFEKVKEARAPELIESAVAGNIGMYPDVASAAPCVDCHNDHQDSPKTDWVLGDVMGATTWTYPDNVVSADAYVQALEAMFASVAEAYQLYLDKTSEFSRIVPLVEEWPADGARMLPTQAVFMAEVRAQAAGGLMSAVFPSRVPNRGENTCLF